MKTKLAKELIVTLKSRGLKLATAESCTGGGIGQALTAVSGSSAVYLGGVIAYDNSVKEALLGVEHEILQTVGAVSEETAAAMAKGARSLLHSDLAVSVTGIAGPNADGSDKPVGLVYIAVSTETQTAVSEYHFSGDRESVREQTIVKALQMILQVV